MGLWTYLLGLPDECDVSRPDDVERRRRQPDEKPIRWEEGVTKDGYIPSLLEATDNIIVAFVKTNKP